MTTTTSTEASASKQPSHVAYQVRERGDKSYWTRIGSAWQHADQNGFSIQLDCLPTDGRISLRVATEKKD